MENTTSNRILLAEDNPLNQKLALILLQSLGIQVETVENGVQAVEASLREEIGLVLMDVEMPEMDGLEATRKIRALEGSGRHVPVVAMTAHAGKGDRERCLAAGMDDYVTKPLEAGDLHRVIRKYMDVSVDPDGHLPASAHTDSKRQGRDEEASVARVSLPAGSGDSIDLDSALARFEDDVDFFQSMFEEFLDHMSGRIADLGKAVQAGDAATVARLAHNLRGMASNFSAQRLTMLSGEVEVLAQLGDLASAGEMVEAIEVESLYLWAFLEKFKSARTKLFGEQEN